MSCNSPFFSGQLHPQQGATSAGGVAIPLFSQVGYSPPDLLRLGSGNLNPPESFRPVPANGLNGR